jgi:peptide/nickel transport system permease protein
MGAFIIRRSVGAVIVLACVSFLTFCIFIVIPGGDPAERMAGKNATDENIANIRETWGFDQPFYTQYGMMMKKVFTADLISYTTQQDVIAEIKRGLPATISLAVGAAIIWLFFGVLVGVISAVTAGKLSDRGITVLALIGISMPVFWLGEVVNLLSQSRFHDTFLFSWVPPLGYTPLTESPFGWFKSLVLPWLVLSVLYIGIYARVLRSSLVEAQEQDYVRTARAKGLTERRVMLRHALRTSLVAYVSLFGLDFGALVGGSALLTEVVFGLPGVGKLTFDSLQNLDLPVIMATVTYAAFFVVLANALVDLVYAWLDPRVRVA